MITYGKHSMLTLKGSHDHFYLNGMEALKPNHPAVRQLISEGHEPNCFGSRIWGASYLLIDYLSRVNITHQKQLLELGCGWGLVSTFLKKNYNADICACDIDKNVFPFQELLNDTNDVHVPTQCCSFKTLTEQNLSGLDVMVGADICYSPNIEKQLLELFWHFAAQGGREIVLADSGRAPFIDLSERLLAIFDGELLPLSLHLPTQLDGYILHIRLKK
ncbi:methyltransferase [Porticoccaceae bacterium LTM1]|nr:methyltransferase [Porticoccaceae bacterium LTM1]